MNFFKSVFSDDPDPQQSQSNDAHHTDSPHAPENPSGAWNFGKLIKTLSQKSESVIEIYRRDLNEFGTGLKKEIEIAHDSLETVGHVIDQFGNTVIKGTAQIISQGRHAIIESDSHDNNNSNDKKQSNLNLKLYNRFESQVRAIQGDPNTYTEEPVDLDRYNKWKLEFSLEGKTEEMAGFLRENDAMESVYKRVVPNIVDSETFWFRYYYKVYKVKKAEDVRARLVRRMSREEEEELSWDVEDDDSGDFEINDDDDDDAVSIKRLNTEEVCASGGEESRVEKRMGESVEESKVVEDLEVNDEKGDGGQVDNGKDLDKKMTMDKDAGDGKSLPVVSQKEEHGEEEKDLEWDEIEDLSSIDEKKGMGSGSPTKVDLLKRLSSAAEEEEDLSWDIEDDDDELAKA
ncbi:uncharacterized protein [Cicer arietinum]|uniref:BSD domain-containing protein 1 n=1 Tax=Cicer arietinum TaxID=3827 RepID=A0A1S2XU16_CICAR|nr:BSD domain-containing protein 1 [Cicer arietinum]XP_027188508.1 BSD domain-containing protein 1 [Cicer arietinum]